MCFWGAARHFSQIVMSILSKASHQRGPACQARLDIGDHLARLARMRLRLPRRQACIVSAACATATLLLLADHLSTARTKQAALKSALDKYELIQFEATESAALPAGGAPKGCARRARAPVKLSVAERRVAGRVRRELAAERWRSEMRLQQLADAPAYRAVARHCWRCKAELLREAIEVLELALDRNETGSAPPWAPRARAALSRLLLSHLLAAEAGDFVAADSVVDDAARMLGYDWTGFRELAIKARAALGPAWEDPSNEDATRCTEEWSILRLMLTGPDSPAASLERPFRDPWREIIHELYDLSAEAFIHKLGGQMEVATVAGGSLILWAWRFPEPYRGDILSHPFQFKSDTNVTRTWRLVAGLGDGEEGECLWLGITPETPLPEAHFFRVYFSLAPEGGGQWMAHQGGRSQILSLFVIALVGDAEVHYTERCFPLPNAHFSPGVELAVRASIIIPYAGNLPKVSDVKLLPNKLYPVAPPGFLRRWRLPAGTPGFRKSKVLSASSLLRQDPEFESGPPSQRTFRLPGDPELVPTKGAAKAGAGAPAGCAAADCGEECSSSSGSGSSDTGCGSERSWYTMGQVLEGIRQSLSHRQAICAFLGMVGILSASLLFSRGVGPAPARAGVVSLAGSGATTLGLLRGPGPGGSVHVEMGLLAAAILYEEPTWAAALFNAALFIVYKAHGRCKFKLCVSRPQVAYGCFLVFSWAWQAVMDVFENEVVHKFRDLAGICALLQLAALLYRVVMQGHETMGRGWVQSIRFACFKSFWRLCYLATACYIMSVPLAQLWRAAHEGAPREGHALAAVLTTTHSLVCLANIALFWGAWVRAAVAIHSEELQAEFGGYFRRPGQAMPVHRPLSQQAVPLPIPLPPSRPRYNPGVFGQRPRPAPATKPQPMAAAAGAPSGAAAAQLAGGLSPGAQPPPQPEMHTSPPTPAAAAASSGASARQPDNRPGALPSRGGFGGGDSQAGSANAAALECVVCLDALRATVLAPCGHRALCLGCTLALLGSAERLCPVCREPVQSYIRREYEA